MTPRERFNQLPERDQRAILDKHRDINTEYDWWDYTYENFKVDMEAKGIEVDRIFFSGFWSQGDGAMFEYTTLGDTLFSNFVDQLDLSPMRKSWLKTQTFAQSEGTHSGHYYHENCCSHVIDFEPKFSWSENFWEWIGSFADQYEQFVISEYKTLCRELYSRLSKYNDELTSDEQVAETIIMNEFEFTKDGNNFR